MKPKRYQSPGKPRVSPMLLERINPHVAGIGAYFKETSFTIATGTPPGVGFARKPPVFLQSGDEVVVKVEGLGELRNRCQ